MPAPRRSASRSAPVLSVGFEPSAPAVRARAATSAAERLARGAAARQRGERRIVALLLATVLGLVLALGASRTVTFRAAVAAQERMGGSLGRAALLQMEFRARNARYALWPELAAAGVRLPSGLAVVATSASTSHWYLRLRDRATGVSCAGVGELLDPPGAPLVPQCDDGAR